MFWHQKSRCMFTVMNHLFFIMFIICVMMNIITFFNYCISIFLVCIFIQILLRFNYLAS